MKLQAFTHLTIIVTIEEKNPLKQGLKQHDGEEIMNYTNIEEKNPLKQGLKLPDRDHS